MLCLSGFKLYSRWMSLIIKFLQTLLHVPSLQHSFHQFNRLFHKKKLKKINYKGFVTFMSPR